MKKTVLFVVFAIVLMGAMAPTIQCYDGYYCEQALSAHGMSWGWNVLCFMEIAIDAATNEWRDSCRNP